MIEEVSAVVSMWNGLRSCIDGKARPRLKLKGLDLRHPPTYSTCSTISLDLLCTNLLVYLDSS